MANKKQIAEKLFELFLGRKNAYAIKLKNGDGKKFFIPHRNPDTGEDYPFSPEICEKHLSGEVSIGTYTLDESDQIRWVALDFDGKKGDALADAVNVGNKLAKELGLISWLERSQSGKGIHLWLFFSDPIPGKVIRTVLSSHIPEFFVSARNRITSFDRMFPHQDSAGGTYGSLCALPLNGSELVKEGKTCFIDSAGVALEKQTEVLEKAYANRNSIAVIVEQYKKSPKIVLPDNKALPVLEKLPGGAKIMSPMGCAWLTSAQGRAADLSEEEWYAALGQFAKLEQGEILAHKFSEPYPNYSYSETEKKFNHAQTTNKPMKCQTIWDKFGDCGKRCAHLGVNSPWELAKVPLNKLDQDNKGKIHDGQSLATIGIQIAKEVASGKRMGFAWGYDNLDDATEIRPKNLIIVAARRSMGKTAVMIDASVNAAMRKIPQYVVSLEQSHEELAMRYLSNISCVDHTLITTGKMSSAEWDAVFKAQQILQDLPIFIDDSTRNVDKMLDNMGELVYKHGAGPIWVDYLQLVRKSPGESKKEAVDRVLESYKQMAKILNTPVVALAQFNRGEEQTENPEEDMDSWLKDSGDIEQIADVIHYIRGRRDPGLVLRRWRIHKERHRPSGINLKFQFNQSTFQFFPKGKWDQSLDDSGYDLGETDKGERSALDAL